MAKSALKFDPPPPTTIEARVAVIESIIPQLATKADLDNMETRLERKGDAKMAELKISMVMWLVSTAIAIIGVLLVAQIGIAFLLIRVVAGG